MNTSNRNMERHKAAKGAFDTRPQQRAVRMKGLADTTPLPFNLTIDRFSRMIFLEPT